MEKLNYGRLVVSGTHTPSLTIKMNFTADRPLPNYPSHFTLRLYQAEHLQQRVSTAVFRNGRVLQVFVRGTSGRWCDYERLNDFNTVEEWIQSVMTVHKCPLVLVGESNRWWRANYLNPQENPISQLIPSLPKKCTPNWSVQITA